MGRLYRPHIPLDVRCRVAMRQLGEMWPDEFMKGAAMMKWSKQKTLDHLLDRLRAVLCADALHLDHDPPLASRPKYRRGLGKITYFVPDANDPEHLFYREVAAHGIKTRVRGEHGQYSDLALIKRARRREKKVKKKRHVWRSTGLGKKKTRPKTRWPKRSFTKKGPRL